MERHLQMYFLSLVGKCQPSEGRVPIMARFSGQEELEGCNYAILETLMMTLI
ncbi:hypothetical protein GBA52_028408 [Prunus armeniaca]|nr:hypothetical protein GBA52_028408 [Prunus armeniaca]